MIDVITAFNAPLYEETLHEMHRMRYDVAVKQWGWPIPNVELGYDKDQFDTDNTIYFTKCDEAGQVIACARLNPTLYPHMLTDIFPEACDQRPIPRAADTFEFSRYFVNQKTTGRREFIKVGYEILAAIAEFCDDTGIKHLSWYAYQQTYGLALPLWPTMPLGTPKTHHEDEAVYIPAVSSIDRDAVSRTKAKARVVGDAYQFLAPMPAQLPGTMRFVPAGAA